MYCSYAPVTQDNEYQYLIRVYISANAYVRIYGCHGLGMSLVTLNFQCLGIRDDVVCRGNFRKYMYEAKHSMARVQGQTSSL